MWKFELLGVSRGRALRRLPSARARAAPPRPAPAGGSAAASGRGATRRRDDGLGALFREVAVVRRCGAPGWVLGGASALPISLGTPRSSGDTRRRARAAVRVRDPWAVHGMSTARASIRRRRTARCGGGLKAAERRPTSLTSGLGLALLMGRAAPLIWINTPIRRRHWCLCRGCGTTDPRMVRELRPAAARTRPTVWSVTMLRRGEFGCGWLALLVAGRLRHDRRTRGWFERCDQLRRGRDPRFGPSRCCGLVNSRVATSC